MVLEKTLESPLDCKEIQPVHSKGDQPWDFFGSTTTLSSDKRLPIVVPGRRKLARLLSRSEPVLGGPCPTLTTGVAQVGAAFQAPLSPCFTPA